MNFPQFISFTISNNCNLRCKMCGQWSEEGYLTNHVIDSKPAMKLQDWKHLVDEAAQYKIRFIIIRGGEPFMFPGIIELVEYINSKGIFVSIDSNGTLLKNYAEDLVRIGNMHITFSVDGPEEIHDYVRGVKGCFDKLKENVLYLQHIESKLGKKISKSVCFTISRYNYMGLGQMPDVCRSLGLYSINIVPYYYVPSAVGAVYEKELSDNFQTKAFSWKGFHHEDSGIDFDLFISELRKYFENLGNVNNFLYMDVSEDEYHTWFSDALTPVGNTKCENIENLIDIQPDGKANFCVDYPDFSFGNVLHSSISELWNSPEAESFRKYRREKPLAVCHRCGAKHMSEIKE